MELGALDVHVWPVKLIASDQTVAAFEKTLSAHEASRCGQFHQARHRRAYALSHGALRALLSQYLPVAADQIQFRYGPADRPSLDLAGAPLEFSMSHSEDLAVYAFARDCRLGVDVEQVRPLPDLESIASRFFSEQECRELSALAAEERMAAFFACWTRKEAYIKATGEGLSVLPVRIPPQWHLHQFVPHNGYIGAVAYEGAERTVRRWPLVEAGEL